MRAMLGEMGMRIRKWHAMVGVCALLAGIQAHAQDQYAGEYTQRLNVRTVDPADGNLCEIDIDVLNDIVFSTACHQL